MLSYQHQYHAGNCGDLLKHTCLVHILNSLIKKDKPFTIIDTHASSGVFDLNSQMALKTDEASEGIKKVMNFYKNSSMPFTDGIKNYLLLEEPYFNKGLYAGSAELERIFLRPQDKLNLIELHPAAIKSLKENVSKPILISSDKKGNSFKESVKIFESDSYKTLFSLTPPLIKRGLILIDPSYEDTSDYTKTAEAVINAHKKWSTAIIAVWYPLITKRKNETAKMLTALEDSCKLGRQTDFFYAELKFRQQEDIPDDSKAHLYGSGMFVINPCWNLKENLLKDINFYQKILSLE